MNNVCGKDLFWPDMVPFNCDTPISADCDTQEEDNGGKDLCSPKMVPLEPYTSPLFKPGFTNCECVHYSKVDEHHSSNCPYRKHVPDITICGSGWEVVCSVCGWFCGGNCRDEGQAIFKMCGICGNNGDHWPTRCPSLPLLGKDISLIMAKVKPHNKVYARGECISSTLS